MVIGLNVFKEYFKGLENSFLLIGGTACDQHFEERGIPFRSTTDLDIILIAEALGNEFIEKFWQFIRDGGYVNKQKNDGKNQYYRFEDPKDQRFPAMLELFSRKADVITETEGMGFTPIPADDDLSSLSAILMDEDYYQFTMRHAIMLNDLPLVTTEALICLKAKAHLDLSERKEQGETIDSKKVNKHRSDVIRLAAVLDPNKKVPLSTAMAADMEKFIAKVEADQPSTKEILKASRITFIALADLMTILRNVFLNFPQTGNQ